jgi:cysteine-rich PDZ-binding protein
MVCAKCAKLSLGTKLATLGVKKKSDVYYGSPASTSSSSTAGKKTSATLGQTGVGKVSFPASATIARSWKPIEEG